MRLRDGSLSVSPAIISAVLASVDVCREQLAHILSTGEDLDADRSELITTLQALTDGDATAAAASVAASGAGASGSAAAEAAVAAASGAGSGAESAGDAGTAPSSVGVAVLAAAGGDGSPGGSSDDTEADGVEMSSAPELVGADDVNEAIAEHTAGAAAGGRATDRRPGPTSRSRRSPRSASTSACSTR